MTGAELKELRHAAGLTQRELAAMVGLHRNTLARLERGEWPIGWRLALELQCVTESLDP